MVLEVFEGPLDLLLTLIRRERLDITTVALAAVTDQYLAYLARLEAIDADAVAEFVEVASTLMLLKSRALLPRLAKLPEEELDSADELVERLRAYRRFKQVAEDLGQREQSGLRAYVRTAPPPDFEPEIRPGEVSVEDLAEAFATAMAQAAEAEEAQPQEDPTIRRRSVRLSDRLRDIRQLLARRGRISFTEVLLGERRDREYIIVSFLAVLELLRRRFLRAVQAELFGDIDLEARDDVQGWAAEQADDESSFLDEEDGAAQGEAGR